MARSDRLFWGQWNQIQTWPIRELAPIKFTAYIPNLILQSRRLHIMSNTMNEVGIQTGILQWDYRPDLMAQYKVDQQKWTEEIVGH